jgi:orotidine 5'-phosphate decarboxylase subfamily 2
MAKKVSNFKDKLEKITKKNNSLVCVGLDPETQKLPKHLLKKTDPFFEFNREIIDVTHDLVCAFKPQIAFYEAEGPKGLKSLKKTIEYLQKKHPQIPTIIDMKRGDIGNTAKMYAKAAFEYWQVDAITAFPNLGYDAVKPFLEYKDRYIFFLVKTSNPDAKMFQDVKVGKKPFYLYLAQKIKKWPGKNVGVFVGATYPKELRAIRKIFPSRPILTAGIGAQGGEAKEAVRAGVNKQGLNLVCNAARSIIYAASNKNFAQAARKQAFLLKNTINKYRGTT